MFESVLTSVFWLITLWNAIQPLQVCCWGTIEVQFVNYTNKAGTAANGECCDKLWFRCVPNACDYEFKICIDNDMNT